MKARRLPSEEFISIYSRVPRLCVDIVVKINGGVVLSKRDITPAKGMWHIPGGTVLWGETLRGAVKRIALHELGIKVKPQKILDVIEYSKDIAAGQTVGIVFLTKKVGGKLRGSPEGLDVGIFRTLPEPLVPEHKQFLTGKGIVK